MLATAGTAKDDLDREHDAIPCLRQFATLDALKEQVDRHAAHFLRGLTHDC